ncbi:helix-turn-helix domain-containing protein [Mesorhizobium retamae]|uniref:XRE family transcriptional regulator n=1 Tax=Mesorhizobium retamae TaxID=2912854 RepID=A0ABS9QI28_9HYPH|nr:helix-turn-helix domain-containing protein [Mesorhizobium sp. IRAMC:0171]MCG7507099.1 XRE family transcriptional regulator [Mesorhizobium sp. IRAMC:0171]
MDNMARKIRDLRVKLGLSQGGLAQRIGVDQSTVSKYERAELNPKAEPAQKLADLAGVTIGEWLGIEPVSNKDVRAKTARVVGELQAGVWREAVEWEYDDQYDAPVLLDPALPNYPLKGYVVKGTSMNRHYPDGSIVYAAATIANGLYPMNGDHVLVSRRNKSGLFEATLKEYVVEPDGSKWLWPRSSDPEHQTPIQFGSDSEEVTVTGIVFSSFVRRPRRAG